MGQTPEGEEKANVKLHRAYRDDPPKRRERGIAGAVAGLPFDNTIVSSAVAAVIMTVVTGLMPNTLNEDGSTVQTPR
jgi:hypothetical protein